jgi:hypothetical protein
MTRKDVMRKKDKRVLVGAERKMAEKTNKQQQKVTLNRIIIVLEAKN